MDCPSQPEGTADSPAAAQPQGGGEAPLPQTKTAQTWYPSALWLHLIIGVRERRVHGSVEQFLRNIAAVRGDLLEDFFVKPGVHLG